MAKPVLLKNLSKRYSNYGTPKESRLVLEEINLELNEGELLTMIGPQGCGKSTILKMIAGLEHPTGGEIYVDGRRIEGVPPNDRNVGFLVPGNNQFEHMTVADNISFGLNFRKISDRDHDRRFEQLVTLMGLEDVLDQSPNQISKVQQRRLALASLLAPQPRVLLLDDPFSGLDTADRQQLRVDTKVWQQELNVSTILATHDRVEAFDMGERIAILDEGRFQQIDTSHNIICNPANAFVARFVGSDTGLPIQGHGLGSALVSQTFLGRPIRVEVGHNDGTPARLVSYQNQNSLTVPNSWLLPDYRVDDGV